MKEQIIETAIRLIESGDPSQFSVAKVAKELGISQGNVTYYYPTREQLVEILVEHLITRYSSSFDMKLGKNDDEVISKNFLHFLIADSHDPAMINTFLFLWLNAASNENIARKLAEFYQTTLLNHLQSSQHQHSAHQQQTMFALLTTACIVNGLIPIAGIAKSAFDYRQFAAYLENLVRALPHISISTNSVENARLGTDMNI